MSRELIPAHIETDCPSARQSLPSPSKRTSDAPLAPIFQRNKRARLNDDDEVTRNADLDHSQGKSVSTPSKSRTRKSLKEKSITQVSETSTIGATRSTATVSPTHPKSFEEFVGQEHLLEQGAPFRTLVKSNTLHQSIILWGPPGTGEVL